MNERRHDMRRGKMYGHVHKRSVSWEEIRERDTGDQSFRSPRNLLFSSLALESVVFLLASLLFLGRSSR